MFGGDERTIAPTPRRLAEARRAGFAPHSQQLTAAVSGIAGMAALGILGDDLWRASTELLQTTWSAPVLQIEGADAQFGTGTAIRRIGLLLAAIVIAPAVAAVVGAGVQRGFRFRVRIRGLCWPVFNRRQGAGRIASGFRASSIIGLAASGLVTSVLTVWVAIRSGSSFMVADAAQVGGAWGRLLITFGLLLGGVLLLLGVADWLSLRRRFRLSLRMTVAEAREEARAANSPRRSRTRRMIPVSNREGSENREPMRDERATLVGLQPLLPSDPLIS